MKVALYARVSLDELAEDKRFQDPENQLQPLREWAKGHDWQIVGEYVDRASGADPARKEFRRLRSEARQRHFQAILVWKMDRFSRESLTVVMGYLNELKRYNVGLISYTESWLDTRSDSPMAEVILAVMAWASAEERRKISERTKAGIDRLRKSGKWRGGRPRKIKWPEDKIKGSPPGLLIPAVYQSYR